MPQKNKMSFTVRPKALSVFIRLALVIICLLYSRALYGAESEYDLIARNFLAYLHSNKHINSVTPVEGRNLDSSNPVLIAHLVTLQGGGYILISASKNLTPIKAYSLKYDFDTLPDGYRNYLLLELEYGIRTTGDGKKRFKSSDSSTTANQERWDFLINYAGGKIRSRVYNPGTHLLTTYWKQKAPYNKFLPKIDGQTVKVGCTSIAVGQLMKYHNHPPSGRGVEIHTWNGQQLKAIFYKNYHWENMPDSLSSITPEFQIDETARLLRDLAIANHSDFGIEATSAHVNVEALIRNFGYAPVIQTLTNSSENQFFAVLRNEIDNFRPVLLKFPGHMTVADGYSSNPTGKEIHVNFGWGGNSDGYYFLNETVETDTYPNPFPTDPGDLEMYYNIKPCTSDCFPNRESEDEIQGITIKGITINGKFNSHRDTDEYKVYLKGYTTIAAWRNSSLYNNQSFILSILDYQHNLVAANDGEASRLAPSIIANLPAGKYTLKFSLCEEIDLCYPYEPYINYTAIINTLPLTIQEKNSINARNISPVIHNTFEDIILDVSGDPYKILIDAVDEDGDPITLSVAGTNDHILASIDDSDVLIIAGDGGSHEASKITVTASTDKKTVQKSFIVLTADDDMLFGKEMIIGGLFENQSTFNKHRVILDGTCTVSGDRGYANQGFYTSVMDLNEQYIIEPIDDGIQGYYEKNQYLIGASLVYGGYQYTYQYGMGDVYTIEILCPESNLDIEEVASMLHISLEGTGLKNPPTLAVDADRMCGVAPLQVQFFSYSQDYDGSILSYQWDFGNGAASGQSFPCYTFTEAGNYEVCCMITDNDGLTAEDMIFIQVNRNEIKMGSKEDVCQENCFEQWLQDGQNRLYLYNTSCGPYTSFDFLAELQDKGKSATLRRRESKTGSIAQSYWFFHRISGKETDFPEETEFSDTITPAEEAYYAVDIQIP